MRILVTGSTGFVGSVLARRMLEMGHEVHVIVRSSSDDWRTADLASHLVRHVADLRDGEQACRAVAESSPDVVFHCATYGGFTTQSDPGTIVETNVIGTMNLLQAAMKKGFYRFINTGSSSEYGFKDAPMAETDVAEPVTTYGAAKAAATLFCAAQARRNRLPVATLRVFSPFGPWDDPRRFLPGCISALLRREPVEVLTPDAVRDYVYIDDLVNAYLQLMEQEFPPGSIFNAGSGVQRTIRSVVGEVVDCLGGEGTVLWKNSEGRQPEPGSWCADTGRAERELGWRASTPFSLGLQQTVRWISEHPECAGRRGSEK